MSVVKARYSVIGPRDEYLRDPVILAQAWKKSHQYIRRHNWYADTLALDCSAVDLDAQLNVWSGTLRQHAYRPTPMRLVPAPKSQKWRFSPNIADGWGPAGPGHLRPLAHMGIREQTVATAVMLCLADCVETAQGDPSEEFRSDRRFGVFSYGNRLNCLWHPAGGEKRAHFSWGNSDTYSRYSRDYRNFIERPVQVARTAAQQIPGELFLLKLDLTAFYDHIDTDRLIELLRLEYSSYSERFPSVPPADDGFWVSARQALAFTWDDRDAALGALLRDGKLPAGLPQGMVSSGFFANAYMLNFDRAIAKQIAQHTLVTEGQEFELLDYSRYVDDLRLVVRTRSPGFTAPDVARKVSDWVRSHLSKTHPGVESDAPHLDLNDTKTGVEAYSEVGDESRVGARMQSIQRDLSGPFDLATLQHVQAGLEGLLALAELSIREKPGLILEQIRSSLEDVGRPTLDVRDDTLTRFSALRLIRALRQQILMAGTGGDPNDATARQALIHDAEVLARRLIAAWAQDPSLSIVLRYAFDLFPSREVLSPVLDALSKKLSGSTEHERYVAHYLLAEIFKAAATETGKKNGDRLTALGDIAAYRARISECARQLLERDQTPWYVLQQIALFLATSGIQEGLVRQDSELDRHRALQNFVSGHPIPDTLRLEDEVAVALVGYQLTQSRDKLVFWSLDLEKRRNGEALRHAFEMVGQFDISLLRLILQRDKNRRRLTKLPPYLSRQARTAPAEVQEGLRSKKWISLSDVIRQAQNPFDQENGLLQLAVALTELFIAGNLPAEGLTPWTVLVKSANWSEINDPRTRNLSVQVRPEKSGLDPRYATPNWCEESFTWMYAIGRLLRAAATGELDFTARQWLVTEEVGHYRGIRSSWHKRRTGMMHTGTAMATSMTPITPWLTELLIRLLQWPGAQFESVLIPDWDAVTTPAKLLERLGARLQVQKSLYGVASRLPVYAYPVEFPFHASGALRVVVVQGLCPSQSEIGMWFGGSGRPQFRTRHRRHIGALRNLVHRQLLAHESVHTRGRKCRADIILFPELAVHSEDQDLLRQLSDATGAMLFFGLLDSQHLYLRKPINVARWLIPQRRRDRRTWIVVDQGKFNLTEDEQKLGIIPWRPFQVLIQLRAAQSKDYCIAGAICYDATDLALLADLRDKSHLFVVPALNRDVRTFDNMIGAVNYHMYQHVIVANTGEFGGSSAQAPYANEHRRLISHVHGNNQIAISIFDIDCSHFGPHLKAFDIDPGADGGAKSKATIGKTRPAGLQRG